MINKYSALIKEQVLKNDSIGARIKSRRQELKMTQGELYQRTGFAHPMIYHYELDRNMPAAVQAVILARALGVTVEWLLTPSVNDWLAKNGFDALSNVQKEARSKT